MSFLLIFFSTVTNLAEGLLIKRYNSNHQKGGFIFTAFISMFSMLFFLLTDRDGFLIPTQLWWYAAIAGLLYCGASFLTYVALQIGSFAISMLILSYSIVISIGYGLFFLKEETSIFAIVGIGLMLISVYLSYSPKKQTEEKKGSFLWLICILASALGSGLFGVVQRMQQIRFENACTNEFMVISLAISSLVLFAIGIGKEPSDLPYVLRNGVHWCAAAGVSNGLTNAMVVCLHTLMPISLSSPIRVSSKILLSFLLSLAVFREKFSKKQIAGVLMGTLALLLLNLK